MLGRSGYVPSGVRAEPRRACSDHQYSFRHKFGHIESLPIELAINLQEFLHGVLSTSLLQIC
jgi:hypothetical protein